jgi:PEP-CTERM motif
MSVFNKTTLCVAAVAAALAAGSASAAIQFEADSMDDALRTAGSSDTFLGVAESDAFSGGSNAIVLEALDAGVAWTSFTLTLTSSDNVQHLVPVSFAGLAGVPSAPSPREDATTTEGARSPGWIYTYTFSGILPADAPLSLEVGGGAAGFTGLYEGKAVLRAFASNPVSAIPEPGTPALMLAGLGALAFLWRRRQR